MGIQEDSVFRRDTDTIVADMGATCVMLNIESGRYHSLSEVGTRIWELLETPRSADALTAELLREFDVDADTCRAAVVEFLGRLAERNLIHVDC